MQIKELNWYSERLHRDMPVKVELKQIRRKTDA